MAVRTRCLQAYWQQTKSLSGREAASVICQERKVFAGLVAVSAGVRRPISSNTRVRQEPVPSLCT
eukprot:7656803-Lingulodinium_polyedra.AAC.1